jgi:hypothetical protein
LGHKYKTKDWNLEKNLIHEFLINMACTMACPNFKKGLKMVYEPLGVRLGLDPSCAFSQIPHSSLNICVPIKTLK